jgi:hypothetical protein
MQKIGLGFSMRKANIYSGCFSLIGIIFFRTVFQEKKDLLCSCTPLFEYSIEILTANIKSWI